MHATRIVGMDWDESHALLDEVYRYLYAPENVTEHVWRRGDLVIWDNFTFQHARGSVEGVGRRILQRVVLGAKGLWDMYPQMMSGAYATAETGAGE
jgi:alpha-ketoglutarate-dependent taurine dioxygenase